MEKFKGGHRGSKSTSTRERTQETTPKFTALPDVPPELWGLIASFSSRRTIARLCLLSRKFNVIFSPHLYMNLLEPPLTSEQSSLLLETISQQPSSSSTFHHPASLIRKLSVKDGGSTLKTMKFKVQVQCSARALDNLRLLPLSDQRGASLLHVLHWGITAGIQELEKILSSPGNFPHLRELVVTSRGNNISVDFIQFPGLEVLGCDIKPARFDNDPDEQHRVAEKMCYNLSEALKMLPVSSPRLRALMLKLSLDYFEEVFPQNAYLNLVDAINLIRLPHLCSLKLSITCNGDDSCYHWYTPPADLAPFLAAHSMITDLSLEGCGLAPIPNATAESLTKLRSFAGSFEQCGIISGKNSNVERIVLTFKRRMEVHQVTLVALTPPTPLHSVTRVTIRAVDKDDDLLTYPDELNSQFYSRLVLFFPNITHLDIVLAKQLVSPISTLYVN
ncbi:hypothetical protein C8J57DRAFT_117869 [Mycena rebaudengoi]|nr:hypothetical protein C8J57DRAFT_117869 [Mycena rebaudengoi]